jgi:hypothetical protein
MLTQTHRVISAETDPGRAGEWRYYPGGYNGVSYRPARTELVSMPRFRSVDLVTDRGRIHLDSFETYTPVLGETIEVTTIYGAPMWLRTGDRLHINWSAATISIAAVGALGVTILNVTRS